MNSRGLLEILKASERERNRIMAARMTGELRQRRLTRGERWRSWRRESWLADGLHVRARLRDAWQAFKWGACLALLVLASRAAALPSALRPDGLGMPDPLVTAYDMTTVGNHVEMLPPYGHSYSEPSAAMSPSGTLVVCANDMIGLQHVEIQCSTFDAAGALLWSERDSDAGPLTAVEWSDPTVRWDAAHQQFLRLAVAYDPTVGPGWNDTAGWVVLSRSPDGVTWGTNQILYTRPGSIGAWGNFPDHPTLTTTTAGRLWVEWNGFPDFESALNSPYVEYSDDGGDTWSTPLATIYPHVPWGAGSVATMGAQSDNAIYVPLFNGNPLTPDRSTLQLQRCTPTACTEQYSTGLVATWPATGDYAPVWTSHALRLNSLPFAESDGDHRILVGGMDAPVGGHTRIVAALSFDHGVTWTALVPIAPGALDQFLPACLWDSDGPQCCFYEETNAVPDNITQRCRYTKDGVTWKERALVPQRFHDFTQTKNGFFGDYVALIHGLGFKDLFVFGALVTTERPIGPAQAGYVQTAAIGRNGCMIDPEHHSYGWPMLLIPLILFWRRYIPGLALFLVIALSATFTAAVQTVCVGDCNGDDRVTIDEVIMAVNIDLGLAPADDCPATECRTIILPCTIKAIRNALDGCRYNVAP